MNMKMLDKETARKIINLKASDLIREAVADRQLDVIFKGFNYLSHPENNALYIADEVGLGKTYIALGIASLLRHFSNSVDSYQDVILVPKENLQNKWAKEIRRFVGNNYLLADNRVKSVIGDPVGAIDLHDGIQSIERDIPGYHIFRNSSFSLGLSYSSTLSLKQYLHSKISTKREEEFLKEISKYTKKRKPFTGYLSGTPAHVKAAINFNDLLSMYKITDVELITDGEKVKWAYLSDNPYGFDTIALRGYQDPKVIEEFVTQYIDRNKIFEKELKNKLDDFYAALNWGAFPENNNAAKFFSFGK